MTACFLEDPFADVPFYPLSGNPFIGRAAKSLDQIECSRVCLAELCICLDLVDLEGVAVWLPLTKAINKHHEKLEGAIVVIHVAASAVGVQTELLVSFDDAKVVETVLPACVLPLEHKELPQIYFAVDFAIKPFDFLFESGYGERTVVGKVELGLEGQHDQQKDVLIVVEKVALGVKQQKRQAEVKPDQHRKAVSVRETRVLDDSLEDRAVAFHSIPQHPK